MATKRMIARGKVTERLSTTAHNQETRSRLKAIVKSLDATPEEKLKAMFELSKRKIDESSSRHTKRCWNCGRPRGVYRRFGLCRCCIFDAMRKGWLVGVRKASW